MFRECATTLTLAVASASAYALQKRDGAGGHDHGHAAAAPVADSGSGYAAPSSGYDQPAAAYSSPSSGYGAVSSGYGEPALPDLTPIIVALLVLTGLSLLFPTYVSLSSVRRKREAGDEDVSPMNDIVERVNDIYMAVVESEECMERIACEIGGLAKDVGLQENSIAKMASPFVPSKYKGYYKQFQSGQNCHKLNCGKLF